MKFVQFNISKKKDTILNIGLIGRMTLQKNQIQSLRVFSKILNNFDFEIKLFIIGNSEFDQYKKLESFVYENNLANNVELLGQQKNIELFYSKFDIFLLTSYYEGCPNVLFEAMMTKCLCVVSKGSNSDSFIKDGYNGFEYDGSDLMLEQKLIYALNLVQSNSADSILNNAYNYTLENFSMSEMTNKYKNLYQKIYENITNK